MRNGVDGLNLVGNTVLVRSLDKVAAVVHQAWQRETGAFVAIKKFERSSNDIKAVLTELDLLANWTTVLLNIWLMTCLGLHVVLEYMKMVACM